MTETPTKKSAAAPWIALVVAVPLAAFVAIVVDRRLAEPTSGDEHGEHEGHEGHGDEEHEGHGHEEHGAGRVKLTEEGRKNAGIEVAKAKSGTVNVTLSLPGEVALNADKTAHVTPRVGGTAREVNKQLGDVVKKGEVLAVLDSKELAELSGQARAAYERLKLAKANFERVEKLYNDKIVPEKEFLASKKELAEAQIEVEATSQMLASAGNGSSGKYNLIAPLDGTIIEKHVSIGEVLKDDTRVFVIADLSTVWVDVTVYAKDLSKVAVGQSVVVRADGLDKPLVGTISFVGAIAKSEARAAQARVVLPNPDGKLKPGLFVTADIALDKADAEVVVPDDAIQSLESTSVVFVEEEGTFEARRVRTGRVGTNGSGGLLSVEIVGGLEPGEAYVEKGSFILKAELGKGSAGHEH
ncbi:MAG: efflux RND transporter periplasmic adaptor subunit [Polyangiaceae bacterium]|nr:efflux RND transporter periplasmic adaptor subunit [Polyangiaceae bacterium]